MKVWDGNGHRPEFTLTDDEVLALAATITINTFLPQHLIAALSGYNKLCDRSEEILNDDRAARR